MSFDKNIFNKLSIDETKQTLIDLDFNRVELHSKGLNEEVYRLRVIKVDNQWIRTSKIETSAKPLAESEDVVVSFFLGGERFFFKTQQIYKHDKLKQKTSEDIDLKIPLEIFHLQRRQNFRFKIPDKHPATFIVKSQNSKGLHLKGKIIDISGGGCKVYFDTSMYDPLPRFLVNDLFEAEIDIKGKNKLTITAQSKHIAETKFPKTGFIIGLQFVFLTPMMESKLYAFSLELYRELALAG